MSKQVHIIGPYNTGTNLLFNIINNCECLDLINNQTVSILHQHKPFDKHTLDIKLIENYLNNPNNILIIMYKNVYNWLYSIKKSHYFIKYTKLYLPVELNNQKFPNMIELYNYYYINYMSLLNRYPNAIFLDYKKVINISSSYDYINDKLSKNNLSINSKNNCNKTLMTPAKTHGNPVKNTMEAQKGYLNKQIMVKNFIIQNKKFGNSIKSVLFDYFENKNT